MASLIQRAISLAAEITTPMSTGSTAADQGGVLSGDNPSKYNKEHPLRLWVIQVVIIITMTQVLALGLSRIRQPRVIAEVIGGIILGPTVMGRIPQFKETIFPDAGMPLLNLTANIGLVIFLFLVGLEIDTRVMKRNIKAAAAVSLAGLVFPLGLGAALAVPIYHEFIDPSVNFGYFILFVAVAVGITAFPVLCRILSELQLLETPVGVITLAAGVGNDIIGWVLLALAVALANASAPLTALWVLLVNIGFIIVFMYPGRWAYVWLCKRTGSLEAGTPTPFMMTVTLLMVFSAAFFTDITGVHAIFGGFLAGLIIPHENGFAISLVEKLEDFVSILLLPLYFTLSGLKTNLGALDNGITWGYTILICVVAFLSKFLACGITAKLAGFNVREAGAIGTLMSCKGLVELIVLNIGLQAKILNETTFSMFVVHALVLTFVTTPLTLVWYPVKHRGLKGAVAEDAGEKHHHHVEGTMHTKFTLVLDKIEQLSAAMTLAQLLHSTGSRTSIADEKSSESAVVTIDALRLIELSERTSAVLKSQAAEDILRTDQVVNVFRTFGSLNHVPINAALSVVPHEEFSKSIAVHANEGEADMILVPWNGTGGAEAPSSTGNNPFDGVFSKAVARDPTSSAVYSEFVRKVFADAPCDVGLFVDRGVLGSSVGSGQHLLLPFSGGPDDRLALSFVLQLCRSQDVTATIIRVQKTDQHLTPLNTNEEARGGVSQHNTISAGPDTIYGHRDTQTRLASETADNIAWDQATQDVTSSRRITFKTEASSKPLQTFLDFASAEAKATTGRTLVAVIGRSRRMAAESHQMELRELLVSRGNAVGSEVGKTLGEVGAAFVAGGVGASLLVVQASIN